MAEWLPFCFIGFGIKQTLSMGLGPVNGPKYTFQPNPQYNGGCDVWMPQGLHASGTTNTAMGDGSVRALNASVTGATGWAAVMPAGGDEVGADW